ncbi:MAG: hypothetical protein M3452_04070, partial [Chloroflexota bacterium]|nr:hypothetical protein [Chloroflexota bacterium]
PLAVLATGAASATAAMVTDVAGGPLGALVAAAAVLVFFWPGALPLLLVGGDLSLAGVGFVVLLMTYALRLVGLLVVLSLAVGSGAVDRAWMSITLILCSLVWAGTQAALVGRSRATL